MWFLPLIGAVLPLLITPGLFFHYETTPKLVLLALAVSVALIHTDLSPLWKRRGGRLMIWLSAGTVICFGLATLTSTRPVISLLGSGWREFGFATILILMLAVLVATAQLARRPDRRLLLLRSIAIAGIIVSIYGILQYFDVDPLQPSAAYQAHAGDDVIVRPPGTMGHADYFAWWLAIEVFCTLELGGWLGGTAAALGAVAILLTGTRAGLLALLVGLAFKRIPIRSALTVVAALIVFALTPAGTRLRHRVTWSTDEKTGGARPLLWRDSAKMVLSRPLLGFGPETFSAEFGRYESEELAKLYPDFHHESPHNLVFDAVTSIGLPGLLLLIGWGYLGWRSPPFIASAVASMFSAAMLGPILLTLLVIAMRVSGEPEALAARPIRFLQPFVRFAANMRVIALAGIPVAGFAILLAISDYRLAQFQRHPEASAYFHAPLAAEDIYCSRMLARSSLKTAITAAARATTTADDTANAWYNLAIFAAAVNDLAGTRRALEQAIAVAPQWHKPHETLSRVP